MAADDWRTAVCSCMVIVDCSRTVICNFMTVGCSSTAVGYCIAPVVGYSWAAAGGYMRAVDCRMSAVGACHTSEQVIKHKH